LIISAGSNSTSNSTLITQCGADNHTTEEDCFMKEMYVFVSVDFKNSTTFFP